MACVCVLWHCFQALTILCHLWDIAPSVAARIAKSLRAEYGRADAAVQAGAHLAQRVPAARPQHRPARRVHTCVC